MGWHDDEEEDEGLPPGPWREALAWFICLLAAAMPTVLLTTIVQAQSKAVWPFFAPVLYVGLFTVFVLIVRPWTLR